MNKLEQIGNKSRLTMGDGGTRISFDNAERVIAHINRYDLVKEVQGIECLPPYHQSLLGYGGASLGYKVGTMLGYLCGKCIKCMNTFDNPKSIGEEHSEAQVCPLCGSDNFTAAKN